MAPLPKKKHTRSRSNIRRGAQTLAIGALVKCSNCGKPRRPHRTCPYCGFYGETSHSK